jgi:O-antigen/teichoic acid export membrane protein
MQDEKSKIASNALAQILGRVAVLVISLASIKLISNYLGPAGTGYYTTIIVYFTFVIVLADFGLFSVAVREISKSPEDARGVLKNIFTVRLLSAIAVTILAVIIVMLTGYEPEIKRGVLVAAIFPVLNLTGSVYDMLFQSRLRMINVVWADVLSRFTSLTVVAAAVYWDLGFYPIVFSISVAAVFNFLIKMLLSRKELSFGFGFEWPKIKTILKMAAPLGAVYIVNNIYFKADALLLFYFKGPHDVGIYAVSYRVLETTIFAASYVGNSLKPLLSTNVTSDPVKAGNAVGKALTFLLFMSLFVAILCLSFPREIILFLSDSDFLPGASALMILGTVVVFIFLTNMVWEIMIAKDMRQTLITTAIVVLLANVILNLILIPRYSYIGAASANLASEALLLIIGYYIASRVIKIKFDFIRATKLILLAIFSIGLAYLIKLTGIYFILNGFVVLLLFGILAYVFDAIDKITVREYLTDKLKIKL